MKLQSERGQALVWIALAVLVFVIAYVGIYGMNSRQNYELAQTVGNDIANSAGQSTTTFVEGFFVVSIFNFSQEMIDKWGDTEVTSFSRPSAKTMQELIKYMESTGYTVVP